MDQFNKYKRSNIIAVVIRHFSSATDADRKMVSELLETMPERITDLETGFRVFDKHSYNGLNLNIARPTVAYIERDGKYVTKAVESWKFGRIMAEPKHSRTDHGIDVEERDAKHAAWLKDSTVDVLFIEPTVDGTGVVDSWYIRDLRPVQMDSISGAYAPGASETDEEYGIDVTYSGAVFRGPALDEQARHLYKWYKLTESDQENVNDPRPTLAALMSKLDVKDLPKGIYSTTYV